MVLKLFCFEGSSPAFSWYENFPCNLFAILTKSTTKDLDHNFRKIVFSGQVLNINPKVGVWLKGNDIETVRSTGSDYWAAHVGREKNQNRQT